MKTHNKTLTKENPVKISHVFYTTSMIGMLCQRGEAELLNPPRLY